QATRRAPAATDEEPASGLLPVVPVTDLIVKDRDVAVATQGRSFWVLDDVSPLRQVAPRGNVSSRRLLDPEPAYRFGGATGRAGETGLNPAAGAWIYYRLPQAPAEKEEVTLEILDDSGRSM